MLGAPLRRTCLRLRVSEVGSMVYSAGGAVAVGGSRSALWGHMNLPSAQLHELFSDVTAANPDREPRLPAFRSEIPSRDALSDDANGGRLLMEWMIRELELGEVALAKWRGAQFSRRSITDTAATQKRWSQQWQQHHSVHSEDAALAHTFVSDLHGVLSPFVHLLRVDSGQTAPGTIPETHLVASRDIEAGMFLFGMPTESVLFSAAPPADDGDPHLEHFLHVDDLIGQLYFASQDHGVSHHGYASYIRSMVRPPRNLPFLEKAELETVEGAALWSYFHETMQCQPLSGVLAAAMRDECGLSAAADVYKWYVSVVMSRRCGLTMLAPLLDKLNHSHEPNAYFSMATNRSMCVLDVVDNLVAGVDETLLQEPFLHVFSIQPIPKGAPITISYSTADPQTPAGRDAWKASWGFTPTNPSVFTEEELRVFAGIVAARRIEKLTSLFPLVQ